ncbi:MAG: galR [Pseudonocardia sp.]|nr:galR [Pseudonocardia sp.]
MVNPATLSEVARMAGVSVATASRVLNGGARRPSEELRKRVFDAALRLNYTPNAAAQAVARGHTNVVGLIVQDISDPYFSAIASGVMSAADRHDVVTTLTDTRRSPEREVRYLATLRQQRCRAVIVAGSRTTDRATERRLQDSIAAFTANGGRVALISQRVPGVDTVLLENHAGAKNLAHELHDLGHRSFVVLAGPPELRTSRDRVAGFRQGLADRGVRLPAECVISAPFTRDGGFAAALEWCDSGIAATCLFAVNDVMAVGAMAALRQRGLALPSDVSVAGFDDIAPLRDIVPALTTVHLPLEQLGEEAMNLVLGDETRLEPRVKRVSGTVVLRESTARL